MAEECEICETIFDRQSQMHLIQSALNNKYSQSQNYYYINTIDNFNQKAGNKLLVMNDLLTLDEDYERLEEYFKIKEIKKLLSKLSEYYKFHSEVPRHFIKEFHKVVINFHNEKRQIKYNEVKKMMGEKVDQSDEESQKLEKSTLVLKEISNLSQKPREKLVFEDKQPIQKQQKVKIKHSNTLLDLESQLQTEQIIELSINSSFENDQNFEQFMEKQMNPKKKLIINQKYPINLKNTDYFKNQDQQQEIHIQNLYNTQQITNKNSIFNQNQQKITINFKQKNNPIQIKQISRQQIKKNSQNDSERSHQLRQINKIDKKYQYPKTHRQADAKTQNLQSENSIHGQQILKKQQLNIFKINSKKQSVQSFLSSRQQSSKPKRPLPNIEKILALQKTYQNFNFDQSRNCNLLNKVRNKNMFPKKEPISQKKNGSQQLTPRVLNNNWLNNIQINSDKVSSQKIRLLTQAQTQKNIQTIRHQQYF